MKVRFEFFNEGEAQPFSYPRPIDVADRAEAKQLALSAANMSAMMAHRATIEQLGGPWRAEWSRDTGKWSETDA